MGLGLQYRLPTLLSLLANLSGWSRLWRSLYLFSRAEVSSWYTRGLLQARTQHKAPPMAHR